MDLTPLQSLRIRVAPLSGWKDSIQKPEQLMKLCNLLASKVYFQLPKLKNQRNLLSLHIFKLRKEFVGLNNAKSGMVMRILLVLPIMRFDIETLKTAHRI